MTTCSECAGRGRRLYEHEQGWRQRGATTPTIDICDICWGSGNSEYPWLDLRRVHVALDATIPQLESLQAYQVLLRRASMLVNSNGVITKEQWDKLLDQWIKDLPQELVHGACGF